VSWLNQLKSAADEVFSVLGSGYRESVYEEALAHELRLRGIAYERQRNFEILYKGYKVSEGRVDLILNPLWAGTSKAEAVVELKAVKRVNEAHIRQAQVYMASLGIRQGVVLSFGDSVLVEEVAPPKERVERKVVEPKPGRGAQVSAGLLTRCAQAVFDYFGSEFIYREGTERLFPAAIGVELRLAGVRFAAASYQLLYKCHPVDEVGFDFVFDRSQVAQVVFYRDEEERAEQVLEFTGLVRHFGLKRGYLVAIPAGAEGKVRVVAVS